ncbi:LeuA family protein [Vibrio profundum]|uniref:LeuA family protein n=1 Tax=Vibrio profundum TaxID=2910247 RepID=UPI003D09C84B
MNQIRFFDTTMRDGEQGIGCLMDNNQKIQLLKRLARLDIETIELGMVTDSNSQALFEEASALVGNTTIAALCRLKTQDIVTTTNALKPYSRSIINLLCIGSELHLKKKMHMSLSDALALLRQSIDEVRDTQFSGGIYAILEDSTRGSDRLLRETVECLIEKGVDNVCLADTVGILTPTAAKSLFEQFITEYPAINFSAHFHNDLGLAVANTIAAIEAGASQVQVTLGGVGERCGNASFEEVVAILECSHCKQSVETSVHLKDVIEVCQHYYEIIGHTPNPNKPLIGCNAFSTCAGIHQSAIEQCPETYEFIDPETIGLHRQFHVNRLSSKKLIHTDKTSH